MQSEVALIPRAGAAHHRRRRQAGAADADPARRPGCAAIAASAQLGLAACVEFIHTATLLHDDVVDESDLRRGPPTANAVWGNKAPVLVGDFLFSRAFQLMVEDGSLRVLDILANASAVIAEGEVRAAHHRQRHRRPPRQAYLEVIAAKTAALFRAACQIGAVIADRPAAEEAGAGEPTARISASPSSWSTTRSTTAPSRRCSARPSATISARARSPCRSCIAFARGDEAERAFWRRTLEQQQQTRPTSSTPRPCSPSTRPSPRPVARAESYGSKAKAGLAVFPATRAKAAMLDLVDFCTARAY